MARKESSPEMSALAGRILLQGYEPTRDEIESLAASVAGQDETKGSGTGRPTEPLPDPVECEDLTQPEEGDNAGE